MSQPNKPNAPPTDDKLTATVRILDSLRQLARLEKYPAVEDDDVVLSELAIQLRRKRLGETNLLLDDRGLRRFINTYASQPTHSFWQAVLDANWPKDKDA